SGHSGSGPFAADAHVHGELVEIVMVPSSPPLHGLLWIGDGLKDTLARSSDEDFRDDYVVIGSDMSCWTNAGSCHFLLDLPFDNFSDCLFYLAFGFQKPR